MTYTYILLHKMKLLFFDSYAHNCNEEEAKETTQGNSEAAR